MRRRDDNSPLVLDKVWWVYKPRRANEYALEPINTKDEEGGHIPPTFKVAFDHRRCVVPVDSWLKWRDVDGQKQPNCLCREDLEPLWLAGIWAEHAEEASGGPILTEPSEVVANRVAEYHPRSRVSAFRTQYY